ncbi:MAG: hypothetical protein Q7V58_07255 [Actinomycetota bacterium]|nr:hypothetical protein [Actinomycetota bacterium]
MPTATNRASYCGAACRARAHRKRRNTAAAAATALPIDPPAPPSPPPAGVSAALLAELDKHDLTASTAGQQALALARRIDYGLTDSGSGIAALSRQLEALRGRMGLADRRDPGEDPLSRARRRHHEREGRENGEALVLPFTGAGP